MRSLRVLNVLNVLTWWVMLGLLAFPGTPATAFAAAEREVTGQAQAAMAAYREAGKPLSEVCGIGRRAIETACFPAGTLVVLADGTTRAIEALRPGDVVLSRDASRPAAEWVGQPLRAVFSRRAESLIRLTVADPQGGMRTLQVTDEHPFAVADSADWWRAAAALRPGDRLVGGDRPWLVCEARPVAIPGGCLVYNGEVEATHTYVVGIGDGTPGSVAWIWVHNTCSPESLARDLALRMKQEGTLIGDEAVEAFVVEASERIARRAGGGLAGQRQSIGLTSNNGKALGDELERVTGYRPTYPAAAHHLIPTTVANEFEAFLSQVGYKHNHPGNGMWLPAEQADALSQGFVRHAGNHPGYSGAVRVKIREIRDRHVDLIKEAGGDIQRINQVNDWARTNLLVLQDHCRRELAKPTGVIVIKLNATSTLLIRAHYNHVLAGIPSVFGVP